jgi:hypothetical protein
MLAFAIVCRPGDEPIGFEFVEVFRKHFAADIGNRPVQLVVTVGCCREVAKDAGLPFCGKKF